MYPSGQAEAPPIAYVKECNANSFSGNRFPPGSRSKKTAPCAPKPSKWKLCVGDWAQGCPADPSFPHFRSHCKWESRPNAPRNLLPKNREKTKVRSDLRECCSKMRNYVRTHIDSWPLCHMGLFFWTSNSITRKWIGIAAPSTSGKCKNCSTPWVLPWQVRATTQFLS